SVFLNKNVGNRKLLEKRIILLMLRLHNKIKKLYIIIRS
ncbi:unnamed protein product, partial [marine sediment metagenome]